jgi:hypothetical protein
LNAEERTLTGEALSKIITFKIRRHFFTVNHDKAFDYMCCTDAITTIHRLPSELILCNAEEDWGTFEGNTRLDTLALLQEARRRGCLDAISNFASKCFHRYGGNVVQAFQENKNAYLAKQESVDAQYVPALRRFLDIHVIIPVDETLANIKQQALHLLAENKPFHHFIHFKQGHSVKSDYLYMLYIYTEVPQLLDLVKAFIYPDNDYRKRDKNSKTIYTDGEVYSGAQLKSVQEMIKAKFHIDKNGQSENNFDDVLGYDSDSGEVIFNHESDNESDDESMDYPWDYPSEQIVPLIAHKNLTPIDVAMAAWPQDLDILRKHFQIDTHLYSMIPETKTPDRLSVNAFFLHTPFLVKNGVHVAEYGKSLIPGCENNTSGSIVGGTFCPRACYTNNPEFLQTLVKIVHTYK